MYIIDPEMYKPLQCIKCESQRIAKMLNTGRLVCLDCGRDKKDTNDWRQTVLRQSSSDGVYSDRKKKNKHPYRDF